MSIRVTDGDPALAEVKTPVMVGGVPVHPLLVTVPIGAFLCALAFDVASVTVEGYVFARGAMWLVVSGLVASFAAAVFGVMDARRRVEPKTSDQRRAGRHVLVNAAAVVTFAANLVVRRSSLDELVDGTPVPALVLTVVGVALLLVAMWLGGALAYDLDRRGVYREQADDVSGAESASADRMAGGDEALEAR